MTDKKYPTEIDREKAEKPRPDLLPARAILGCMSAMRLVQEILDDVELIEDADRSLQAWKREPANTAELQYIAAAIARALWLRDPTATKTEAGPFALARMRGGEVMGYGFRKHGNCIWRYYGTEQSLPSTHAASLERHLLEWQIDEHAVEEGSKMPVLWHAFAQVCILIDLVEDPPKPPELPQESPQT